MRKTTYGWTNNPLSPHLDHHDATRTGKVNQANLRIAWQNVKQAVDAFASADSAVRRLENLAILTAACDECCRWLDKGN